MRTDSVVKAEGMEILLEKLGRVDAERFVSLLLREPFDYTQWHTNLNKENISVRELSSRAMEHVDI